jgi:hypothetical protein
MRIKFSIEGLRTVIKRETFWALLAVGWNRWCYWEYRFFNFWNASQIVRRSRWLNTIWGGSWRSI